MRRVLGRVGKRYLAIFLAAGLAFGAAGRADLALAQAAPQSAKPSGPPNAFDGARFSIVAGAGGVPLNVVEVGDPSLPALLLIHGFRQAT